VRLLRDDPEPVAEGGQPVPPDVHAVDEHVAQPAS
jgi:hypothetical protein